MSQTPLIWITADGALVQDWAKSLGQAGFAVHVHGDQPPNGVAPDVIVRDLSLGGPLDRVEHEMVDDGSALILLSDHPSEVSPRNLHGRSTVRLPRDAQPREIVVACLLLTEIVRLRRAHQEKHDSEQRLTHLALTDPLTGVANRRGWENRAVELLISSADSPSCLVLIDLDHFKEVNTQFGMGAGDACLREVALRLANAVRKDDLVARLGGDEFALWLPGVDAEAAPMLIDRVRESIGTEPLQSLPHVRLTASAGWVSIPASTVPVASPKTAARYLANWVDQADRGLRAAKIAGRDRTTAA